MTTSLEQENGQLRHDLKLAQEDLHLLLQEKDEVAQVLTRELHMKDVIVSQLEQDFARMESQMLDLKVKHRIVLIPADCYWDRIGMQRISMIAATMIILVLELDIPPPPDLHTPLYLTIPLLIDQIKPPRHRQ